MASETGVKEGVRRFLSDFRESSTCYRIHVKVGDKYEPHPTEPTFGSMTEAELRAASVAGPTRVDVEIAEPAKCDRCEKNPVSANSGFCGECASEIQQDIDLDDCFPVRSRRAAMDARVRSDDVRVRRSGGGE